MKEDLVRDGGWSSDYRRINCIDIHYLRTSPGKPSLIALHGLIGSSACLSQLARSLEKSFDVVLPDARGHGHSSSPLNGYTYPQLASDVSALIDELDLSEPVLLGHSMGGMTAALVASELGHAIKALILIDPTFLSPERQREVHESNLAAEHRHLLTSTREELLTRARLRSPNRSAETIHHLVDARHRTSVHAFKILTPPNPDYRELIEKIEVPMLLVIGDRGVVSLEEARKLQALNRLLHFELIPEAGHGMVYDEPEQVGAAVYRFLDQIGLD